MRKTLSIILILSNCLFLTVSSLTWADQTPLSTPTDTTLPAAPSGGTLIEWSPCPNSKLANPVMVNECFLKGSEASTAYIIQHGAQNDFDVSFSTLFGIIGDNGPIASPGFLTTDDKSSFWRAGINLGYAPGIDSWAIGNDDATGASCSSFSQYDAIIDYYNRNLSKFRKLKTIVIVGHSGGGNFVSRFSTINTNIARQMRYIIANAANQGYFDTARPTNTTSSECPAAFSWPYQWTGSYNRYVGSRIISPTLLFNQWATREVIHLTGDQDTATSGTQTCQSVAQGGSARRDRNYAYWAYINILAGTRTDVSKYPGYEQLLASGAKRIGVGFLNHKACTVAGVGHDAPGMLSSACGKAALLGQSLPAGAGPSTR